MHNASEMWPQLTFRGAEQGPQVRSTMYKAVLPSCAHTSHINITRQETLHSISRTDLGDLACCIRDPEVAEQCITSRKHDLKEVAYALR